MSRIKCVAVTVCESTREIYNRYDVNNGKIVIGRDYHWKCFYTDNSLASFLRWAFPHLNDNPITVDSYGNMIILPEIRLIVFLYAFRGTKWQYTLCDEKDSLDKIVTMGDGYNINFTAVSVDSNNRRAKAAVRAWTVAARKMKGNKDIRNLVGKMIWQSRREVPYTDSNHPYIDRDRFRNSYNC